MTRGPITVSLVSVTSTDDGYGNVTTVETATSYDKVKFAPRSSTERADSNAPAVITAASLYRRDEFPADAADQIVIAGQHAMIDGTWQVDGEAGYWGRGVEVAIKRVP